MSNRLERSQHQIVIRSPAGSNPSNFSVNLTHPISLNPNKHYVVALHNGFISASWNTAPVGTAFTFNGSPVVIPRGHYTFETLSAELSAYMTLEAISTTGRCKLTSLGDIVMGSLAPILGFLEGNILGVGDHIGSYPISINPVNFIRVVSNLVDINNTRSNEVNIPILRTSILPKCLSPYEYFDLCGDGDDYYVKANRSEINAVDIRLLDENGNIIQLDDSIRSNWTLTIREMVME